MIIVEVILVIRLMIDDMNDAMPWDRIDTVVFDVGNVLLSWKAPELLARIIPERPDLHAELTKRVFHSPYWSMRDRGSATVEEVIGAMSLRKPELEPYIRRIMHEWIDLPAMPEGVETLRRCKEHDMKLYALTNYADSAFAHACEQHDFFRLFDGFLVSGREHTIKPSLDIYRLLINRFQLDPARTLFIDDSIMNIEAALECGLQALHYNRKGKLREFFAN